jgi:hypothetical protein
MSQLKEAELHCVCGLLPFLHSLWNLREQGKRRNFYHDADGIKHFIQISFPLPNRHNVSTVATEALGNVPTSLQATLFFLSSRKLYLQSEDLPRSVQQF